MTASTTIPPEVETYLARVREELSDLPTAERDDLLADVEASVYEAAAEGGTLTARLGQPEDFAAELRAAAGLQAPPRAPRTETLAARVRAALAHPRALAARETFEQLAPIWWVARAYVVVAALALWWEVPWSATRFPVPLLGNGIFGTLAIVVAAAASTWLGFRARTSPQRPRRAAVAANVLIALAALPVLAHLLNHHPMTAAPAPAQAPPDGLAYYGIPVDNVYPFTRDGDLLLDVLLYDGAGRPLELNVGEDDPNRRLLEAADGTTIFNSAPIRYFEPGTTRVARPDAAPPVEIPEIETPPLEKSNR